MGVAKYLLLVIIMLVLFLSLINLTFKLPVARYEIILTGIFMIFALIVAIGFYADSNWGYVLGAIFFALNLLNLIYLYYRVSSRSLVWYGIAGALGFLISVASIGKKEKLAIYKAEKKEEVKKEIGRIEKEKPKVEIIKDELPKTVAKPAKKTKKRKGRKKGEVLKNF